MTCAIQEVQVVDRFRKQLAWSLGCVAISSICFYVTGLVMKLPSETANASQAISNIPQNAWTALEEERPAAVDLLNQVQDGNIPLWMMIPIAIIILLAVLRLPTLTCLAAGIVSATVMGAFIGTITSLDVYKRQIHSAWILISSACPCTPPRG